MDPTVSIILDFESLDTIPSAVITEIGAIAVRRSSGKVIAHLELIPHIIPQLAMGRTFSAPTIAWAEKKGLLPGKPSEQPLAECVRHLHDFIAHHAPFRIWAWGKDFERPILENISAHCGLPLPDHQFRKFACARDQWQNAFGMESKPPERTHHAYQDTLDELRDLRAALKKLGIPHMF